MQICVKVTICTFLSERFDVHSCFIRLTVGRSETSDGISRNSRIMIKHKAGVK